MSDKWDEYVNDPRIICKYGSKCYQKNSQHHTTYKHPPLNLKNTRDKHKRQRFSPYTRKQKANTPDRGIDEEIAQDAIKEQESGSESNKKLDQEVALKATDNKNTSLKHGIEKFSVTLQDNITFYESDTNPSVFKDLFLVEMPSDFFKLFECLGGDNNFVKSLSSVNLEPIGPYDLLLGKLPILDDKQLYLMHWRFFYDPPEFQAVLKRKGKSEYHIGYYRDDPKEKPVFLASNDSSKDFHITPIGQNIFGAIYSYLLNEKKSSPFTAMACQGLINKIKIYAEENNYSLEEYNMRKRLAHVVTKTFHGAGIVVPYNKKTQLGYRHLAESDANIKKLFTKFQSAQTEQEKDSVLSEIQPIITYASIAVDECDFGTGLEAGIALFCSGFKELEPSALSSLTSAYTLLNREAFSKIIQAHLRCRRKGPNMSVLSLNEK